MIFRLEDFLWRQLNGPQVNAIITSVFHFFRDLIQPILDYFVEFNITKSNTHHLNLFGILLGIPRPLVWSTDDPFWTRWFRYVDETTNTDQGFSDPDNPLLIGIGGLLSYNYVPYESPTRIQIDEIEYRRMLQAITMGEAKLGSLILLDKFISIFFEPTEYTITQPSHLNPGDIVVSIFRANEIANTALLSIFRLWLPNTHVILSLEV